MKPRYFVAERQHAEARARCQEPWPPGYLRRIEKRPGPVDRVGFVYTEGVERTSDHRNALGVFRTRVLSREQFAREFGQDV